MTDDVNSESSAAAPEDAPQPKKPRAKKVAAGTKSKEPAARRGAHAAETRPRKAAAETRKAGPATKQAAEKRSSEADAGHKPRTNPAELAQSLQPPESVPSRKGAKATKQKGTGQKGTGFSPYMDGAESARALAPEGSSSPKSPSVPPASATSETAPKKKSAARRKPKAPEKAAEAASQFTKHSIEDPIGDVSDGEAWAYTGEGLEIDAEQEAYRSDVAADAVDGTLEAPVAGLPARVDEEPLEEPVKAAEKDAKGGDRDDHAGSRPPARLERLQKILSQAGIASRRHAEEMIVAGRVEVNGQVVTVLGSKADPEHDHIRVDGKLLHGAERHRYFVLNKPKGYVTTVSDPEGRPTVMDFVRKLGERVYPVGRLDFQSEGLLLMTNDGTLANQLMHASSGVEKTYLVKISGQPDEEELERLRKGVMIERGDPSSSGLYGAGGRVRTAPARIRQIRPGENPWYEVVLTEGRNREIRKMFSAIGHYAEKIRRVGYGPLALDLEPGKLRELTLVEVDLLRQAAEGKLRPRRLKTEAMLPKEAGRSAESRPAKKGSWKRPDARPTGPRGKARPERGRGDNFRRSGKPERDRAGDIRREEPEHGRADSFRRRGEEEFGSEGGKHRDGGERREWQPRPPAKRPARAGSDQPGRVFARRRQVQIGKPDFARRREAPNAKPGNPEERGIRDHPNRPGTRWQSNAGQRPFRPEGRTQGQGGGRNRSGAPENFAPKGNFGSRYPQRGKPQEAGREQFSGERGRNRGGFGSNRKPGNFRTGPRPGGRRPTGGNRRG